MGRAAETPRRDAAKHRFARTRGATSYVDGSWTNAEYNDGICHYRYSHNTYDGETHVNRYGDCSHIAIGPNGEAIPLPAMPIAVAPY